MAYLNYEPSNGLLTVCLLGLLQSRTFLTGCLQFAFLACFTYEPFRRVTYSLPSWLASITNLFDGLLTVGLLGLLQLRTFSTGYLQFAFLACFIYEPFRRVAYSLPSWLVSITNLFDGLLTVCLLGLLQLRTFSTGYLQFAFLACFNYEPFRRVTYSLPSWLASITNLFDGLLTVLPSWLASITNLFDGLLTVCLLGLLQSRTFWLASEFLLCFLTSSPQWLPSRSLI